MVASIKPVSPHTAIHRRRWSVRGQVQGVGFRPFVYRIAGEERLHGFVRNDGRGVTIEAQGTDAALDRFAHRLTAELPPLAHIRRLHAEACTVRSDARGSFTIKTSVADDTTAQVTVDSAVCADCLRELLDPRDRRHGYALINCTHCGPRYTLVTAIPYDRPNTTMAGFTMCPACEKEYRDPSDRRFHAQPTCCPDCGPAVTLVDMQGHPLPGEPIAQAARWLLDGKIIAVKGLGGFHLAVRADLQAPVQRLRDRKHREAKPLAVMVRDLEMAQRCAVLSGEAQRLLASPAAPIVLAQTRAGAPVADAVAPGTHRLGVMLPYTPMHHLLFAAKPALGPLVMTSANLSDEPLVIEQTDALDRLHGIADALLGHDRPIARSVDDSVWLERGGFAPLPIRRSRGFVPAPITLPVEAAVPGLCVGGELKNTVAVVRGDQAVLSQHLGDLKHPLAFAAFQRAIDDLLALTGTTPAWIACDRHPQYLSAQHARKLARRWGVPLLEIQHHHAHAAALLAEHQLTEPALNIICDGVGYGDGGATWGGELLLADLHGYRRLAHLQPLRLLGGDAAARDTRRCALALLYQAYGKELAELPVARRLFPDDGERAMLVHLLDRNVGCVSSTAAGRVFDGVAALLGFCDENRHEAEAPMALEAAAHDADIADDTAQNNHAATTRKADGSQLFTLSRSDPLEISLVPLTRALVEQHDSGRPDAQLAALFHEQFAAAWSAAVERVEPLLRTHRVGLSGGVFCNARLTDALTRRLRGRRLEVLRHRVVPPNDGGLSLGQAAIAAASFTPEKQGV